jgi:hypothetical protein
VDRLAASTGSEGTDPAERDQSGHHAGADRGIADVEPLRI